MVRCTSCRSVARLVQSVRRHRHGRSGPPVQPSGGAVDRLVPRGLRVPRGTRRRCRGGWALTAVIALAVGRCRRASVRWEGTQRRPGGSAYRTPDPPAAPSTGRSSDPAGVRVKVSLLIRRFESYAPVGITVWSAGRRARCLARKPPTRFLAARFRPLCGEPGPPRSIGPPPQQSLATRAHR
jgi:hypothetical protein